MEDPAGASKWHQIFGVQPQYYVLQEFKWEAKDVACLHDRGIICISCHTDDATKVVWHGNSPEKAGRGGRKV
jgi:hypothetical protein